ncbi:hypothetical protein KEM52_005557 [Ascosphaera acerosa]|nr:hypothetical protein KEM52_005557 [Ascosphaera acerosa]
MSSDDPGEKFWLSYWNLEEVTTNSSLTNRTNDLDRRADPDLVAQSFNPQSEEPDTVLLQNGSIGLTPAFPLHYHEVPRHPKWSRRLLPGNVRSLLAKRDYKCPQGSNPCDSIGRPDKCCGSGDTCQSVQDTGLGDVGCCSGSDKCASNRLDSCPWGYTDCPDNVGGGCCMPGYQCVSQGCLYISSTTVYYQPPPTTLHTPAIVPANRPTSNNGPVVYAQPTPAPSPTVTVVGDYCPTGYYSCAAQYYGGCCRVDRECNPTSCPEPPSTVTVTAAEEPATIYVAPTQPSYGRCAAGWFACAADLGSGCCPDGYGCGSDSCTSTKGWAPTRTQVLPKSTPDDGASALAGELSVARLVLVAVGALVVAAAV